MKEAKSEKPNQKTALEVKLEAIENSKMPLQQKMALKRELGVLKPESDEGKVSFLVWAKLRKIPASRHKAMLACPCVGGIKKATFDEWDKLFKNF